MALFHFTSLLALISLALASPSITPPDAISTVQTSSFPGSTSTVVGLNAVAQSAGKKYFGTGTDNPELTDTPYVAILSDNQQFGQLTPTNSMKWDAIEPEQGVFTFSGGDQIVALAQQNGQIMRGHNLVWFSQLPAWVTAGNFNASELTAIIQNHVTTEVSHYKGQIFAWDVVNEPFNSDGTLSSNVFF